MTQESSFQSWSPIFTTYYPWITELRDKKGSGHGQRISKPEPVLAWNLQKIQPRVCFHRFVHQMIQTITHHKSEVLLSFADFVKNRPQTNWAGVWYPLPPTPDVPGSVVLDQQLLWAHQHPLFQLRERHFVVEIHATVHHQKTNLLDDFTRYKWFSRQTLLVY